MQLKKFRNLFVFGFLLLIFFFLLVGSPGYLCPDTFYHTKLALTIKQTGSLVFNFPWLSFTALGGLKFVDHHLLFHILGSLFVSPDSFLGMQIYVALLGALSFFVLYLILKKLNVSYPFLWILLLFSSSSFLFRILLLRTISFSLLLLLVYTFFLLKKKFIFAFLIAFLFVWTYNGFPLVILISIIALIIEKIRSKKADFRGLLFTSSGVLAGIIINPYFPRNIEFYKIHILTIPFTNGILPYDVGTEWYPPQPESLIRENFLLWICFSLIIYVFVFYRKELLKKMTNESLIVTALAFFFFLMTLKSQRFIEYWVPFTVFSAALLARDHKIDVLISTFIKKSFKKRSKALIPILIAFIAFLSFPVYAINQSRNYLQSASPFNKFEKASVYLRQNSAKGENVYNVFWDDFPALFYWNDYNNYISGMDTMFLCKIDKERCDIYRKVAYDKDQNLVKDIKHYFSANLIFIGKDHNIEKFESNPNLIKKYEDDFAIIYQVKNE